MSSVAKAIPQTWSRTTPVHHCLIIVIVIMFSSFFLLDAHFHPHCRFLVTLFIISQFDCQLTLNVSKQIKSIHWTHVDCTVWVLALIRWPLARLTLLNQALAPYLQSKPWCLAQSCIKNSQFTVHPSLLSKNASTTFTVASLPLQAMWTLMLLQTHVNTDLPGG